MAALWQISVVVFAAVFATVLADTVRKPGQLVGAPMAAKENETGVRKALDFAMKEYNRASNDKFAYKVSKVLDAKKQVVSGLKYFLTVQMARTSCTNSYVDAENCAFHEAPELSKTIKCTFEVYTIPWKAKTTLNKKNCE